MNYTCSLNKHLDLVCNYRFLILLPPKTRFNPSLILPTLSILLLSKVKLQVMIFLGSFSDAIVYSIVKSLVLANSPTTASAIYCAISRRFNILPSYRNIAESDTFDLQKRLPFCHSLRLQNHFCDILFIIWYITELGASSTAQRLMRCSRKWDFRQMIIFRYIAVPTLYWVSACC